MPTFDGAHYFLSVLVPIKTKPIKDGQIATSPVHALRKCLDKVAPAAQTPACCGGQSPFAQSNRTHFARLVIIDDVAYPGRLGRNTLLNAITGENLTLAQSQDHLSCPFLFFAVDFDAKSGADHERNSYLEELWGTMEKDVREIFAFCEGFDSKVKDARSFAAYMASCQLETTMSFNDYYVDPINLPVWQSDAYKWGAIVSAAAFVVGLVATLLLLVAALFARGLSLVGAVALGLVLLAAYMSVMAAGGKPFPAAPDSNLPTVLKALYLQRKFTRFAIDSQMDAAGTDEASAKKLYDDFKAFVATNKPTDIVAPTQPPGVVGI
jgi:hypothetical protein